MILQTAFDIFMFPLYMEQVVYLFHDDVGWLCAVNGPLLDHFHYCFTIKKSTHHASQQGPSGQLGLKKKLVRCIETSRKTEIFDMEYSK